MADGELTDARVEAERVARESYGRLLAFLASRTHDVAAAEDALADAFAAALAHWPVSGVPRVPEAWLLVTARRRMADEFRRRRVRDGKSQVLDGPYAETKEQLGGYYLIEAENLDAAIEWGARCPGAAYGSVEVRPLWRMAS